MTDREHAEWNTPFIRVEKDVDEEIRQWHSQVMAPSEDNLRDCNERLQRVTGSPLCRWDTLNESDIIWEE